jgi:hypothetical protein
VIGRLRAIEAQAGQPARKLLGGWEIIGPVECPLMLRRTLLSCRWFKLLWHEFFPGASDRVAHDHPRSFVTFVVRGGYDDLSPGRPVDRLRAPAVRFRRAEHAHITRVHGDGAKTLVVMGPLRREWGFWHLGAWLPWREHERRYGLGFRCEDS